MKKTILLLLAGILLCMNSCKKDWLEEKRSLSLLVPATLSDMRLLLNNTTVLALETRTLGEISADDYYLLNTTYQSLANASEKNGYTWNKELYGSLKTVIDWDIAYKQVFYANVILEGLEKIQTTENNLAEYKYIKGNALFIRGKAFFNLAQSFAPPYNAATAERDWGIPLRLVSDINAPVQRATVRETYDQIIADLSQALELVRVTPDYKTDASITGVCGYLARVYLSLYDYEKALQYADRSLQLYSTLINFNTLSTSASFPFALFNAEVTYHSVTAGNFTNFLQSNGKINPDLISQYHANDLRLSLFFQKNTDGTYGYKGSYQGENILFMGLATDELYLIRAECYARTKNIANCLKDLDALLITRYKTGTYIPLVAGTADEALILVLRERRKELIRRGLRWLDLRRLNTDTRYAAALTRSVNNQVYTLPPNDPRYVFPIPDYVIRDSGIPQNPR